MYGLKNNRSTHVRVEIRGNHAGIVAYNAGVSLAEKECNENVCSHAYLLLYNDAKNILFALNVFAKAIFLFLTGDTRWGHTARANAFGYLRGMLKVLQLQEN